VQPESILDYTRRSDTGALRKDSGPTIAWLLVLCYFTFTVLAVAALHVPGIGTAGQELSFRRTVFTAVNATTLTGFQQDVGSSLMGADVLRLVLTLGSTLFVLIVGGMAVVRIARMEYTDGQVVRAALVAVLAATMGGAAFLFDVERGGLLAALMQAASAFGNSGVWSGPPPGELEWRSHAILLPLAFCGAIGLPVLMELFDRIAGGKRLSLHSRSVVVWSAGVYLAGILALVLFEVISAVSNVAERAIAWRHVLALASVFSVDARSAGLPFDYAMVFSRPAQWILVALMIIGGAPGSAAGGLKTTTLREIVLGVRDNLLGRRISRVFGVAFCWMLIYFAIAVVGFFLLLQTEPDISSDRLLFLAFSATSNVGLSHDPISITGDGLFTLSAMMLLGRLAPLGVLWWMASRLGPTESDGVAVG
jgi:trk system potassium uptake protein TrkH